MENHEGWQVELKWNRLALIAQLVPSGFRPKLARGGKPTELDAQNYREQETLFQLGQRLLHSRRS